MKRDFLYLNFLIFFLAISPVIKAQEQSLLFLEEKTSPDQLKEQVLTFVEQELQASLDEIQEPDQMPEYLFGEPTGGGFSWGGVAKTLSRFQEASNRKRLGDHQLDHWIKKFLLKEVKGGNTTFSQLSVAEVFYRNSNGKPIQRAPYWKDFTTEEQKAIVEFLDVRRFYDAQNDDVGGRPNNYYGVALLIAAHNVRLGIEKDQEFIEGLFKKCLDLLAFSNGYLDDSRKFQGGFDRYHHEFVRFVWEAAEILKEKKIQQKLEPVLRKSGELWWDLFSPATGHSSLWGRSRQNSWGDSFEQAAFFAQNPEISPASKEQLAAAFISAYHYYLNYEYNLNSHLNRMLDFGRGTYSYAGRNRIWSYTIGTLGKMSQSLNLLTNSLKLEKIKDFPTELHLPDVNRFQVFRDQERIYGIWILRKENNSIALPVVGNAVLTDYLPVPFGIAGIELPVSQKAPTLVPFIKLPDGSQLTTAQGADAIELKEEDNSLSLTWDKWSSLKGELKVIPIQATATWQIEQDEILYQLIMKASEDIELETWQFWIPVSYTQYNPQFGTFRLDQKEILCQRHSLGRIFKSHPKR
jgi:hypothetical protein